MVKVNDNAKKYMLKFGWNDVVLSVEEFTS